MLRNVFKTGILKITTTSKELRESTQLQQIPRNQETVDELFTRFNVKDVETNLLESAQFKNWDKAVSKVFGHRVFRANHAMMLRLTQQHGEKELSSILAAAKQVPDTKYVAVNLLRAQIEHWVEQKIPADKVFEYLKLDKAGDDLFTSLELTRWMAYVGRTSGNPYKLLGRYLRRHYDDQGLANVLIKAKGGFAFGRFDYYRAENLILQKWVTSGKTTDEVYDLLKLQNVKASEFLQNPALDTWLTFVTKLDTRFYYSVEGPYKLLYERLIKQYDDKGLADVILGPKGGFGEMFDAYKLDDLVIKKWVESGKTMDEVYDLLQLRNVDAINLLQTPALNTWLSFVERMDHPTHDSYKVLYNRLYPDLGQKTLLYLIRVAKKGDNARAKRIGEKLEKEFEANIAKYLRRT
ncbi:RxLR effector protein [Phytophthora megakarya]|uniref:RxLR effector protein n=1 Tax=Phytophthora megakarya TaxID=4795 RepID=A0A225VGC1_9STRA|nr:RxLR effector protein [Phytophthora megakarya]